LLFGFDKKKYVVAAYRELKKQGGKEEQAMKIERIESD
jgi:hypothetical protein